MKNRMFKLIIIMIIIIILTSIYMDYGEEERFEHSIYEMTIIPHNNTSDTPYFEIGVPFIFPKKDPDYYINKTKFTPNNVKREVVINGKHVGADNYMRIVGTDKKISFVLDYYEKIGKWEDGCYHSINGRNVLVVYYNGTFEYLEIKYHVLSKSPSYKEITAENKTYQQGFNVFDTTIEDRSWVD